jgi:hypothetical protein
MYILLRGCWCDIVVNIHATTGDKVDDMKASVCEELECVFSKFSKYHVNTLLGDFSAKVGKENIFKPIFRNENIELVMIMELEG